MHETADTKSRLPELSRCSYQSASTRDSQTSHRAASPDTSVDILCPVELMRRSFLSNAVRRLTIAGPREAASSLGGASGVAGSLLQPLHFLSPAAAAITPKPSAYGLSGSGFRSFSASAFSRAGGGLHDVLHKEYTQEMGQEPDVRTHQRSGGSAPTKAILSLDECFVPPVAQASVGTPPNSFKVVDTPGAGELVSAGACSTSKLASWCSEQSLVQPPLLTVSRPEHVPRCWSRRRALRRSRCRSKSWC